MLHLKLPGFLVSCIIFYLSSVSLASEEANSLPYQGVKDLTVGGEWYLSFEQNQAGGDAAVRFRINRGYLVFDKKISDNFSARFTPDVTLDKEGDGRGDTKLRIKYLHVNYKFSDFGFVSNPHIEAGVVHRPWIGFEEHINAYRVQGTMFLERVKIVNSADMGVAFLGLLGGSVDSTYQKRVSKSSPGRYGSFAIGLFNGGGYHAIEENNNKSVEGRLSIRPLPDVLPGLQFSYTGLVGKGNIAQEPKWTLNAGFVSYETARLAATVQYFTGTGNSSGSYVDAANKALGHDGYSLFVEYKAPAQNLSLLARYDKWNGANIQYDTERIIAGVAYTFAPKCKLVLNYDYYANEAEKNDPLASQVKLDMLVKF